MNPKEHMLTRAVVALKDCIKAAQVLVELYDQGAAEVIIDRNAVIDKKILHIKSIVCIQFGLSVDDLVGNAKPRNIVDARHTAMWLVHKSLPRLSSAIIGIHFGGRDHGTVLHALSRMRDVMSVPSSDPLLRETILNLEKLL